MIIYRKLKENGIFLQIYILNIFLLITICLEFIYFFCFSYNF